MHCTAAEPFESLILVDEYSFLLVSTSFALRLPRKVEHLLGRGAGTCNYTVTSWRFSGPDRESLQLWFLFVETSLLFKLRFVASVFRRSGRRLRHVAFGDREGMLHFLFVEFSRDEL